MGELSPEELQQLSPSDRAAINNLADKCEAQGLTHRQFAESPEFCNLELSPLVAAVMDAASGITPTTITDEESEKYFGCPLDDLPTSARRTIVVRAGGRGGKTSRLLATKALHAAWTVPLKTLRKGEHAVALIVSSEKEFAAQALSFVKGYIEDSPVLSKAVVGDSKKECVTLKRPDGNLVDIKVRAAGGRGKGGRAHTLVGAFLDEACFFYDDSGVVSDREIYRAAIQRVVDDGQVWLVSTPWVKDLGLLEEIFNENHGCHETALAVCAPTRALNPNWDPTGEIEKKLREDPDNAAREIDAVPLAAGSQYWFSHDAIDFCVNEKRPQTLAKEPGYGYAAGGDAGFRRNSSALVIIAYKDKRYPLALIEERKPEKGIPLRPADVVAEFAPMMSKYGVNQWVTDSHERDQLHKELTRFTKSAIEAPSPEDSFTTLRQIIHEGRFEMPSHPRLRTQLRGVLGKPMPGGGTKIILPKASDGSHGDLAAALANAVWRAEQLSRLPTNHKVSTVTTVTNKNAY